MDEPIPSERNRRRAFASPDLEEFGTVETYAPTPAETEFGIVEVREVRSEPKTDEQPETCDGAIQQDIEVFDEWRVTGQPGPIYHNGVVVGTFPSYSFVWSKYQGPDKDRNDPEGAARAFMAVSRDWADGPYLHHRTITRTAWQPAEWGDTDG